MTPTHIADCAVASLMRMAWPFAAQEQGMLIARSDVRRIVAANVD